MSSRTSLPRPQDPGSRPALPRRRGGRVVFQHFGEGAYEEIERAIQQQLGIEEPIASVEAHGVAEAAQWDTLRTPETYVGSARGDRPQSAPLALNGWSLAGR